MINRLRVLHVTNMWPNEESPYAGSFVAAQVNSLVESGVDCRVVHHAAYEKSKGAKSRLNGGVFLPEKLHRYTNIYLNTKDAINSFKPDIIHVHFGYTAVAVIPAVYRTGIPIIVSYCGSDILTHQGLSIPKKIKRRAGNVSSVLAGYKANHIIVKSQQMKETLPNNLRKKTTIIPNGVNDVLFKPSDKLGSRKKLGLEGEPIALFSGLEYVKVKNSQLAHAAIEIVKKDYPGIKLVFPSNIPHRDMPYLYNAADLLLVTSFQEGSPNMVKEALACNLPVVYVPVGDTLWLLKDLECCHHTSYEATNVAEAIIRCLRGSNSACLGRETLIKRQLTERQVTKRIIDVYESVRP